MCIRDSPPLRSISGKGTPGGALPGAGARRPGAAPAVATGVCDDAGFFPHWKFCGRNLSTRLLRRYSKRLNKIGSTKKLPYRQVKDERGIEPWLLDPASIETSIQTAEISHTIHPIEHQQMAPIRATPAMSTGTWIHSVKID